MISTKRRIRIRKFTGPSAVPESGEVIDGAQERQDTEREAKKGLRVIQNTYGTNSLKNILQEPLS